MSGACIPKEIPYGGSVLMTGEDTEQFDTLLVLINLIRHGIGLGLIDGVSTGIVVPGNVHFILSFEDNCSRTSTLPYCLNTPPY